MNFRISRGEEPSGEGPMMTGHTQGLSIMFEEGTRKEGDIITQESYYQDMFNLGREVTSSLPQVYCQLLSFILM